MLRLNSFDAITVCICACGMRNVQMMNAHAYRYSKLSGYCLLYPHLDLDIICLISCTHI